MRAKQAIFVLTALFSLVASTLAACGCSHHHQTAGASAEAFCHASSHAVAENPDEIEPGDNIETGCICLVRESGPSLSSKSSVPTDSSNEELAEHCAIEFDRVLIASRAGTANYYSLFTPYDSRHGTRAPTRAPPRL